MDTEASLPRRTFHPVKALPRHRHFLIPTQEEVQAPAWRFENSLFASYRADTDAILHACFQSDYAQTRLDSKLGKRYPEDVEAAKEVLAKSYGVIKDVFKHYGAAYSSGDSTFNVTGVGYNEILTTCLILDPEGKGADRPEVDTLFISINMTGPKVRNQPASQPARNEMMLAHHPAYLNKSLLMTPYGMVAPL